MTTARRDAPALELSDDAAISAAVYALLHDTGESVADLAYHTRISTSSLYRKLGGQISWRASDIGAVARRYRIRPGDLFLGPDVLAVPHDASDDDAPREVEVRHQGLEPRTRWFGVSPGRVAVVIPFPKRVEHRSDLPVYATGRR